MAETAQKPKTPKRRRKPGPKPKLRSVEKVNRLIRAYFAATPEKEVTYTGLARALDVSGDTMFRVETEQRTYSPGVVLAVKRARARIDEVYEGRLRQGQCAGAIFALKQRGWTDKPDIKIDVTVVGAASFTDVPLRAYDANGDKLKSDKDSPQLP